MPPCLYCIFAFFHLIIRHLTNLANLLLLICRIIFNLFTSPTGVSVQGGGVSKHTGAVGSASDKGSVGGGGSASDKGSVGGGGVASDEQTGVSGEVGGVVGWLGWLITACYADWKRYRSKPKESGVRFKDTESDYYNGWRRRASASSPTQQQRQQQHRIYYHLPNVERTCDSCRRSVKKPSNTTNLVDRQQVEAELQLEKQKQPLQSTVQCFQCLHIILKTHHYPNSLLTDKCLKLPLTCCPLPHFHFNK